MSRAVRTLGRSLAVARFAVESNVGRWLTRGGLLAGAAVMAAGPFLSVQRGLGWRLDREIGSMGFIIMAVFLIRSGLEEQRHLDLGTFMRHNLVTPLEHGLGLVLGLACTWLGLCAVTFLAVLLTSGGDASMAAWGTAAWGLRLLLLLGFVPLVEAVATLRLPLVLPAFGYLGLLVALTLVLPEEQALALFIPVARGEGDALARLAVLATSTFGITSALFVVLTVSGRGLGQRLQRILAPPPWSSGGARH